MGPSYTNQFYLYKCFLLWLNKTDISIQVLCNYNESLFISPLSNPKLKVGTMQVKEIMKKNKKTDVKAKLKRGKTDTKFKDCCVFWPSFRCFQLLKIGRNTFLGPFSDLCLLYNLVTSFFGWKEEKDANSVKLIDAR